jgi:predicted alpha/beta hydrolase
MQASSDIMLGWQRSTGIDGVPRDYYVRQLQDWKGSIDTEEAIPEGMKVYGELCAHTLARAHARSGDRIAIASYLGNNATFDKALARFAESYADQNERDYEAFAAACKSGRLHAEEGL